MDRPGLRSAAQRKERRYICPDPFAAPVVSVGKPFATRLDLYRKHTVASSFRVAAVRPLRAGLPVRHKGFRTVNGSGALSSSIA